jgi:hypothetical protein
VSRELELIALAARGRFTPAQVEAIPVEAFTGAPALFAWTCAAGACVRLGTRSSFDAARHLRATCPRLDMPLDVWAELHRETADVIDAAERLDHEWARQAAARRDG